MKLIFHLQQRLLTLNNNIKEIEMINKIILILLSSCFFSNYMSAQTLDINNDEINKLMNNNVPIVDIRTSDEWKQTGIVPNSVLLTFFEKDGSYNFETWYRKLGYLIDINKPFILICRSGRRTKLVSKMLNNHSDMTIYNAENGINSWLKSNLNTVKP